MTEDMKKSDSEIKALWGKAWDSVQGDLETLGSVSAPAGLKNRILNRDFSGSHRRISLRFGQITGAVAAAALCAMLVLKTYQAAPPLDDLSDNDVITLAEVLDSDSTIADISFDLLDDDDDEIDLISEDV